MFRPVTGTAEYDPRRFVATHSILPAYHRMPGPVIYVAVAISAVAAVIVFKEVSRFFILQVACSTHRTAISSSMILISVQGSLPGGNVRGLDLTRILFLHHPHPRLKMMKASRLLSEAPSARRNRLSDQQNPAPHHLLTYSA